MLWCVFVCDCIGAATNADFPVFLKTGNLPCGWTDTNELVGAQADLPGTNQVAYRRLPALTIPSGPSCFPLGLEAYRTDTLTNLFQSGRHAIALTVRNVRYPQVDACHSLTIQGH